jgi:hypothetical protein
LATALSIARGARIRHSLLELDAPALLTAIIYLFSFAVGFLTFTDPDYWWHFRTGQYIVQHLSIPHHDLYSFTAGGQGWVVHEWLSEVLLYLTVSRLGYAFAVGLFMVVSLTAFALMQRLLLRLGTPPMIAVLLITLSMLMSAPFWTVRPQMLSWCFIALFVSVLFQRDRPAWALVAVSALWANMHMGFTYGLGVVGLWFIARVWERRADHTAFDWKSGLLFVLACCAATLLNPNGPALWLHATPFAPFVGRAVDLKEITEWSSPNFHHPLELPLLAGLLLLLGLGFVGQVKDRFAILLALMFTMLVLYSSRNQPLFAVAFLPAAGLAAASLWRKSTATRTPGHGFVNLGLVALIATALLVSVPSLPHPQLHSQAITDGSFYYPATSLARIRQDRPQANVFAHYEWGGYFINGLYPQGHVFIDGRADMYGATILHNYQNIIHAKDGWQQVLDASGADTIVLAPTDLLASAVIKSDQWTLVLRTSKEELFYRRR